MLKNILTIILFISSLVSAQIPLEYYIQKGTENSPELNNLINLGRIGTLQNNLIYAENSALNIYLSADLLFAPYFNNNGKLISTDPLPGAIGYDVGITNGGEYSAQLNVEKNIFNGKALDILEKSNTAKKNKFTYEYKLEKHNLVKQITDKYLAAYKSLKTYNLSLEIIDNLKKELDVTAGNIEQGFADTQSYMLLKIELQSRQTAARNMYRQYVSDLYNLNALCGIKDTSVVKLPGVNLKMNGNTDNRNFTEKYLIDSMVVANEQNVSEIKYLPQLKAFFNTGLNSIQLENMQRKVGFSAGLSFSLPLYDGGQKEINREQNIIKQRTIGAYKNYSELNLEFMRNDSKRKIESLTRSLDETQNQLDEYGKLIRLNEQLLQGGNVSVIDYLTLLKNYTEMKNILIEYETNLQMEINNYNYWNW